MVSFLNDAVVFLSKKYLYANLEELYLDETSEIVWEGSLPSKDQLPEGMQEFYSRIKPS